MYNVEWKAKKTFFLSAYSLVGCNLNLNPVTSPKSLWTNSNREATQYWTGCTFSNHPTARQLWKQNSLTFNIIMLPIFKLFNHFVLTLLDWFFYFGTTSLFSFPLLPINIIFYPNVSFGPNITSVPIVLDNNWGPTGYIYINYFSMWSDEKFEISGI